MVLFLFAEFTHGQSAHYVPNLHLSSGTIKAIILAEHESLVKKKKKIVKIIALVNYQDKVISVMGTGLLVSLNAVLINGHYNNWRFSAKFSVIWFYFSCKNT